MKICFAVCAALACVGLALAFFYTYKKEKLTKKELAVSAVLCAVLTFAVFRLEQKNTEPGETVKILWILTIMTAAAYTDAEKRIVPNVLIFLGFAGRCLLYAAGFWVSPAGLGKLVLADLTELGITMTIFLFLSFISRGGLGAGDIKLLGVSGLHCGFSWTCSGFLYGTGIAACVCAWLLISGKADRKYRIPMVPYILAGCLVMTVR